MLGAINAMELFYINAYWGKLMVLTFACALGCRKQNNNFLHFILSKALSHRQFTFNVLNCNAFFPDPYSFFNKVTLHCSIIKLWLKIFNISIAHY